MKKIFFYLSLLTVPLLSLLFIFKISLTSDLLFLDSLYQDISKYDGSWWDWKLTPAPAYIPDMILYGIFYHIIQSVPARILAVSLSQAILLLMASIWLYKIIRGRLTISSQFIIVIILLITIIVASNSRMWLFFYSTHNHFSSLLLSLISLGLYFKLVKDWSKKNVLLFCISVLCAQLSSSLFVLTFSLPLTIIIIAQLFILSKDRSVGIRDYKFLFLILLPHIFAYILEKTIYSHDALLGRVGLGVNIILNSVKAFIKATKVTFGYDNIYTFIFCLFVVFTFSHLTYYFLFKKRMKFKELIITKSSYNSKSSQLQDFTFLYLILSFLVTIFGSIVSGGFIDIDYGYRYFSFPIALCLILWVLILDNKTFFDRYFSLLIGIYILSIGIAYSSSEKLFKESKRVNYYQLYKTGAFDQSEMVAECLNYLSNVGVIFKAGVANYWDSRGVSYKTTNNFFILPISDDATPHYWMSSLGPLKHSQRYNFDYYNFAILYKANVSNQFNINTSTIGKLLPKPSETFNCDDREIWIYKDLSLNKYVKEKINKFLTLEQRTEEFDFNIDNLPNQTGRVNGSEKIAVQGIDRAGYLSYGPYIRLPKGKYRIKIKYQSNSEKNYWDIGRFNDSSKFFNRNTVAASGGLPNTQNLESTQTLIIDIKHHISEFELRIFYGGEGDFVLRSLKMMREEIVK